MNESISDLRHKKTVHINIGDFHATKEKVVLKTVLGSCVSVCLYDPLHNVAGMNHILLVGHGNEIGFDESSRYGVNAMECLINDMIKKGACKACFMAKVFGGGHILYGANPDESPGTKNVKFVLDFLHTEKIKIVSQSTGGTVTRSILFDTETHDVFVKRIPSQFQDQILADEERFAKTVQEQIQKPGDIELFD